MICAVAKLN